MHQAALVELDTKDPRNKTLLLIFQHSQHFGAYRYPKVNIVLKPDVC